VTRLADRTAVITGAGSGLGRALAHELALHGCDLALSDLDLDAVEEVADSCRPWGVEVTTRRLDVADRRAVLAYVDELPGLHGDVHVLINNAGVILTASAVDQRLEELDDVLGVDLGGVVTLTQALLPQLIASGEGHVVNISSIFGMIAAPTLSAYAAAKFAVRGYTEGLSMDLAVADLPVRATCVHPGALRTGLGGSARTAGDLSPEGIRALFDRIALTSPERAARVIARAIIRERRRVLIGPDARVLRTAERVLGSAYQPLLVRLVRPALQRARRHPRAASRSRHAA
jgi:NADP-dependent 3-hydroxy acid dehydrogenase YdfG